MHVWDGEVFIANDNMWTFGPLPLVMSSPLTEPTSSPFPSPSGIALMLERCNWVDVYEFVPSLRMTKRCHYYDTEENEFCTLGAWHPLAAEKLLALRMNHASDRDVFERGVLRLKGYSQVSCR